MQALSSAGDLVIPSRKAEMHPRIEWQRYKIDGNSVHVLTRLTRSGRCKPMHTIGAPNPWVAALGGTRRCQMELSTVPTPRGMMP